VAASAPAGCDHGGDQGGPVASDYVNIADVTTRVKDTKPGRNASLGTFRSACGRNTNNHRNSDNFIVAPGVSNAAHQVNDYVGNLSTDGFSTQDSLRAAGTTCEGNDRSAYFWPVLRSRPEVAPDAGAPGGTSAGGTAPGGTAPGRVGGVDGNTGTILRPDTVRLEFRGNAKSTVRAMPAFLRMITGDA
jgi:hypothetical protein